jgi:hypothetical protein
MIAIYQRLGSLNISWNFAVLGKFIRKRGRSMVFNPSGGDRRVVIVCLTLITSKPRLTSPSDMSSAEVLCGRWRYHRLHEFSGVGIERVIGQVIGVEVGFD